MYAIRSYYEHPAQAVEGEMTGIVEDTAIAHDGVGVPGGGNYGSGDDLLFTELSVVQLHHHPFTEITDAGRNRITSYNVCYTKLLRSTGRIGLAISKSNPDMVMAIIEAKRTDTLAIPGFV